MDKMIELREVDPTQIECESMFILAMKRMAHYVFMSTIKN